MSTTTMQGADHQTSSVKPGEDKRITGITVVLSAAAQHAKDSGEYDHEVGDLQDVLHAAWGIMTNEQRQALLTGPAVQAVMEAGGRDPTEFQFTETNSVPSTDELLHDCIAFGDKIADQPMPRMPQMELRRSDHEFKTTLRRWDLGSGGEAPMANEPNYGVHFEAKGEHLWLDVSPVASTSDDPLCPSLQLAIEINNGLPCVHVYTNSGDEVRMSLFGDTDGKVCVRPGEGMEIRKNYFPLEDLNRMISTSGYAKTFYEKLKAGQVQPQPYDFENDTGSSTDQTPGAPS